MRQFSGIIQVPLTAVVCVLRRMRQGQVTQKRRSRDWRDVGPSQGTLLAASDEAQKASLEPLEMHGPAGTRLGLLASRTMKGYISVVLSPTVCGRFSDPRKLTRS